TAHGLAARDGLTAPRSVQPARPGAEHAVGIGRNAERALVALLGNSNDRVIVRRRGAGLEGLEDLPALSAARAHAGARVEPRQLEAGGRAERHGRLVGERGLEEVLDDRRGELTAGRATAEMPRLVEADIAAHREVRRVTDEPGVFLVVGGAGLAGDGL